MPSDDPSLVTIQVSLPLPQGTEMLRRKGPRRWGVEAVKWSLNNGYAGITGRSNLRFSRFGEYSVESIEEILPGEPVYRQWGEEISVLRETVENPEEAVLSDGLTIHSAGSPENVGSANRPTTSRNMEKQKRAQRLIDKMREGWQARAQRQPELEIMQQLARQMKEQQEANSDIDPAKETATPRPGPSSYRMALENDHREKRRDKEREAQGSKESGMRRDPVKIETRGTRRRLSLGRSAQLAAMILDSDDSPERGPSLLRDSRGEQIRRRCQPPDVVEERVEKEIHRRVAQLLRPRDTKTTKRPLTKKTIETSDGEGGATKAKTRDPVPRNSKETTVEMKKNEKKNRRRARRGKWKNRSPSTGASQATSSDGAQEETPPRNPTREMNDPPRRTLGGEAAWDEGVANTRAVCGFFDFSLIFRAISSGSDNRT